MTTQVAIITGASRGIGRAVARQLARDGMDIGFCYTSNTEAARSLETEIIGLGSRVYGRRLDVADPDQVNAWVEGVEDALGNVTTLVASAATLRDRPLVMMEPMDWQRVIEVNLGGVHHVCRAVVESMMRRRSGAIVTVSSLAGLRGNPCQTNYSAAKAGIIGYTKALALEVGRYGIRANVVAPGFIATDLVKALPETLQIKVRERVALRRLGRPEEVADLVSFLVSDRASYLTGEVISLDGGMQ